MHLFFALVTQQTPLEVLRWVINATITEPLGDHWKHALHLHEKVLSGGDVNWMEISTLWAATPPMFIS